MMTRRFYLCFALLLTLVASTTTLAKDDSPIVRLDTSAGIIDIKLFPEKAPKTVKNFLAYVDAGFYDDTIFHRVIDNFMVQGGGFTTDFVEKETQAPIANESINKLHNIRGTVAMARTNDPDSATAQFFINQRSNLRLDWSPGQPGYAVFGEVIRGMGVIDFIATAETGTQNFETAAGVRPFRDVPIESVVIKTATRHKAAL